MNQCFLILFHPQQVHNYTIKNNAKHYFYRKAAPRQCDRQKTHQNTKNQRDYKRTRHLTKRFSKKSLHINVQILFKDDI